jgi:ankyrin repeat protein
VRRLVVDGLNPNAPDRDGLTPLHFAAVHWRVDMARALLEAGVAVDAVDRHGNTQ